MPKLIFIANAVFLYCATGDAYISYRYLDDMLAGTIFNAYTWGGSQLGACVRK